MSRTLSFASIGLLAACLTLAAPSSGRADYYPNYGYGGYGSYRTFGYGPSHSFLGYRGYGHGYHGHGYYGHGYGRPAVIHPEYSHWTPGRGWHTHGHLHVPHRGHYHTHRY